MKKSKEFLKKLAVITLSCTSLLQFTSVFAEGPENLNVGKSKLSVFKLSDSRSYTVQHGTINQQSTPSKSPRPPYSQQKENTYTPKKPAKKPPVGGTVEIGDYLFPAEARELTSLEQFRQLRPIDRYTGNEMKLKDIYYKAHCAKYQHLDGTSGGLGSSITFRNIGGVLGWILARSAVLAGYKVPPAQEIRAEWDIYANPKPNSDLERTLISQGLWIERMRLTAIPKGLQYADGKEFTEIDKRIFCEIRTNRVPPEWKKEYMTWK